MTHLERILLDKRAEVEARARSVPIGELEARARAAPQPRSLLAALLPRPGGELRVIAEVKKASPSRGVIRADFDPTAIACAYEQAGAAAISVLTDEKHFQGRLEHLEAIRREVRLPILRKDFVIDPYQVWEARASGADAILLILGAVRDDRGLADLASAAKDLGMDVLWEVHDDGELRRALALGPAMIGINNRDLRTFEVSLETTRRLAGSLPRDVVAVSESGFSRREELLAMRQWGVAAFLIGESLLRQPDPGAALYDLIAPEGSPERCK